MAVLFLGVDDRVPGAAQRPTTLVEAADLLDRAPRDCLLCVSEGGVAGVEEVRQLLRAGVRRDVRLVEVPVTPTALVVTAVAVSAGDFPAGTVAAVAAAVAERCCTYTLGDSVAAFTRPAPSVVQHARSLLPGSRFLVTSQPPAVRHVGRTLPQPAQPAFLTVSTSADDESSQTWREELDSLFPSADPGHVDLAAPTPPGARRWAELTAVPLPVADLVAQLRRDITVASCPWCSADIARGFCPYCGIRVAAREVPGPRPVPPRSSVFPHAEPEAATVQPRRAS